MRNTMKARVEKTKQIYEKIYECRDSLYKMAKQDHDTKNEFAYLSMACECSSALNMLDAILENDMGFINRIGKIYGVE